MHPDLTLEVGTGFSHTVVTTTANELVQPVHPTRMVVIINPENYETWLTGSPDEAHQLLRPYLAERMRIVQNGVGVLRDEGAP